MAVAAPAPAVFPPPDEIPVPEIEFHPPKPDRVVLDNGMIVYLLEDHELPLFGVSAIVKVGSWLEPDEKLGLAEMTGAVMRSGGTESMSADKMNETLEFIAGSVETSIGQRSGSASINVMSKDLGLGIEIFADVLMHPAFAPDKVEVKRQQMMESIRRRNDEPAPICGREYNKVLYKGHPFGRVSSLETVNGLTRTDLIAFHKKYFFPNNIILAVSGDFKKAEVLEKLKAAFAGWQKGAPPADPPAVGFNPQPGVYFVQKAVPQSTIRLGHLGILKKDPDYFAIEVMNWILGGSGFTSRLMREIRSNRGLAYGVGSYFTAGQELGVFGMVCQTKTPTTAQCITAMREIAAQMTEAPVSEDEVKLARDSILNSFVFEFQSASQIVSQAASIEFQGLPPDFLEIYKEKISKVTAGDVLRVAKKHLLPDKMTLMVVGDEAKLDKPLSSFGKVNTIALEDFSLFDKKHGQTQSKGGK